MGTMSGREKKINPTKNHRAWVEWQTGKKIGRRKQIWVWDYVCTIAEITAGGHSTGHWEKI
jgi:hypothetical protein